VFAEGSTERTCVRTGVAAFTQQGSHVVYICSNRIANRYLPHVRDGEIVVLHEMLHSLGLGENPPSTDDITRQVMKRCGH
jgi:hypothetical protein